MSNQNSNPTQPAKSLVGPLEELYLVAFIAEGEEQQKIEKALRAWADKWLCLLQHDEVIDQNSVTSMTPEEQRRFNANMLVTAKQKMGEALAMACGNFREGPLNDVNSINTGKTPQNNYRQYSMMAIRRWER